MDVFENNKYSKWYFDIISHAKMRINDAYIERHHIVPVCFYIKNRSKGRRPGWILGNPNEPDNLVCLTPREHFVCHWLLIKMVKNKSARIKMEYALSSFQRSLKTNGLSLSSMEYQRLKLAYITSHKGRVRKTSPLKGKKQIGPTKNWYNNGIIEIKSEMIPNQDWIRGRLSSPLKGKENAKSQGITWWNNGTLEKRSHARPDDSWTKGRITKRHGKSGRRGKTYGPHSDTTKEKISAANKGKTRSIQTRVLMSQNRQGRATVVKGTKYWNNGRQEIRRHSYPGKGWQAGRIKKQVDGSIDM